MTKIASLSALIEILLRTGVWLVPAYCAYLLAVSLSQSRLLFSTAKGLRPPAGPLTHSVIPTALDVDEGWIAKRPSRAKLPAVPAAAFASDRR
jgi:hypothetical protein